MNEKLRLGIELARTWRDLFSATVSTELAYRSMNMGAVEKLAAEAGFTVRKDQRRSIIATDHYCAAIAATIADPDSERLFNQFVNSQPVETDSVSVMLARMELLKENARLGRQGVRGTIRPLWRITKDWLKVL